MNEHAGCSGPPNKSREDTQNQVRPDSRNDRPQPLEPAAINPDLSYVTIKGGSEIHEHEAHLLNLAAEVFAGEAMRGLMHAGHTAKQKPELDQSTKALRGEVVELETIAPYLSEFSGPHQRHQTEQR